MSKEKILQNMSKCALLDEKDEWEKMLSFLDEVKRLPYTVEYSEGKKVALRRDEVRSGEEIPEKRYLVPNILGEET